MNLLRCLHQAVWAILRHPVATLLGIPLLVAFAAAGSVAPWVGVFFLLLAAPQLLGAVPALALAAVDAKPGEHVDWKLFLQGFRHYERWLGLFGVSYLVTVALAIPTILAFWLRLRILPESAGGPGPRRWNLRVRCAVGPRLPSLSLRAVRRGRAVAGGVHAAGA